MKPQNGTDGVRTKRGSRSRGWKEGERGKGLFFDEKEYYEVFIYLEEERLRAPRRGMMLEGIF